MPHTNSDSCWSARSRRPEAVVALGLVEVDVAQRGVERRAAARRQVGAQELVDADSRSSRRARRARSGARSPRSPAAARSGAGRARAAAPHERRPAAVAQPRERRRQPDDAGRPARGCGSRPRTPRGRPSSRRSGARARSRSASRTRDTARAKKRRVVGRASGLHGVAEARQVDREDAALRGERRDGGEERRLGAAEPVRASRRARRPGRRRARPRRCPSPSARGRARAGPARGRRSSAARKPTPRWRLSRICSRPPRNAFMPPRRSRATRATSSRSADSRASGRRLRLGGSSRVGRARITKSHSPASSTRSRSRARPSGASQAEPSKRSTSDFEDRGARPSASSLPVARLSSARPDGARGPHPLRPGRDRGARVRALVRVRALPPRADRHAGRELLDRDPAAERHRRAAHGPRAQRLDPGHADPLRTACAASGRSGSSAPTTRASRRRRRSSGCSTTEGTSREEIGREAFVERVWRWREQYGGTIIDQFKRLGASCDYAEERFTLDEAYVARGAEGLRRRCTRRA